MSDEQGEHLGCSSGGIVYAMNRNVSETARVLDVDIQQVKTWAWIFKEYLSGYANPAKGRSRAFTDSDLLVLIYVAWHWEEEPDMESIKSALNSGDHHNDRFRELLYGSTPILQEPPEDLDETWRHGIFLNGGGVNQYLELSRNYKQSAEALLDSALASREPREWGYPVLFAYRHSLELYLKVIGEIDETTHSLKDCVEAVEKRHRQQLPKLIRDWIIEFDQIDPFGTAFRYADDEAGTLKRAEFWVDFLQLKFAMSVVFKTLDGAILRSGVKGKPPKKKVNERRSPK